MLKIPSLYRAFSIDYYCFIILISSFLILPPVALPLDAPNIGDAAPTFILKNLNGENTYLRDYCGKLRSCFQYSGFLPFNAVKNIAQS